MIKNIYQHNIIQMTIEEAKDYLRNRGMSSCSCKYGGFDKLIEAVIRMKEEENKKTPQ
jgi:hypothetical protein